MESQFVLDGDIRNRKDGAFFFCGEFSVAFLKIEEESLFSWNISAVGWSMGLKGKLTGRIDQIEISIFEDEGVSCKELSAPGQSCHKENDKF